MHDVIIIGAGPAGYTAGIYCSRARHDTLLISGILPGGQLMNTTYGSRSNDCHEKANRENGNKNY